MRDARYCVRMIGIKEKSLWRWICKGGLPGQWRRIEHRGTPDTVVNYKRRTFFVELKQMDRWPAEGGPIHLELRPAQVSFFKSWRGEKYVLMRVGMELFWFDGKKRHVLPKDACSSPFA